MHVFVICGHMPCHTCCVPPQVQAYLDVIDKSNGYYLYRWGDAPIHTMVRLPQSAVISNTTGLYSCTLQLAKWTSTIHSQSLRDQVRLSEVVIRRYDIDWDWLTMVWIPSTAIACFF